MVFVKGGCFQMGDSFGDGDSDEKPVHEVCVDDFYIGKYEVTVGEFKEFINATGYNTEAERGDGCYYWTGLEWAKDSSKNWRSPGFLQDDSHPVCCITWNDAVAYTEWLSGKRGSKYRLPTEAEWEYAARSGGKNEKWAGTNSESELGEYAWHDRNSGGKTHPVKQKRPNGIGLYDMSGNVWEWCSDWYKERYYGESPKDNPRGPNRGVYRARRGGSWVNKQESVRVFGRHDHPMRNKYSALGFRLVRSP
jgi:formylglycine-generating enzyme required for sulfatase activity